MADTILQFSQVYHEELVKLALAVVLAGLLGLEREYKGRTAGLRTHILVCLGSTLAMMVSGAIAQQWNQAGVPVWLDSGRIAAGILTGVGFLGAGAIITGRSGVQGLTTAAIIWFVAALGIAIGAGLYSIAIIATFFALFVVVLFQQIEWLIPAKRRFSFVLRTHGGWERAETIHALLRKEGNRTSVVDVRLMEEGGMIEIRIEVNATRRIGMDALARTCMAWKLSDEEIRIESE
jgi:putative Mg2+ transporter-C (MgtC) family protein